MKLLITIWFLIAGISLMAQQRPHYTQYILNNYILNHALSGIENYADLKISGRDQWAGLEGAPRTAYISFHMPFGKTDYRTSATSFEVPGENPRGSSYWQNYRAPAPHHGAGAVILNDRTGLFNRFSAGLSYAYHLGLGSRTSLAAGFAGGVSRISYDLSKATPDEPADPALLGNNTDLFTWRPDLSAGLWLYGPHFFAGLSAQQLIPQKVRWQMTPGFDLVPHIFATAGYRFLLAEDVNALPSLMLRYVPGTPADPHFDINLKIQYRDLLWAGASYRRNDGYAVMLGFNAANTVNIGYAYDITRTALNTVSRGSHEIIIGFLIGNRYDDSCPRNIW